MYSQFNSMYCACSWTLIIDRACTHAVMECQCTLLVAGRMFERYILGRECDVQHCLPRFCRIVGVSVFYQSL